MAEQKKIYLVVTPFFPSDDNFSGSYIFDQLNEIRKQSVFIIKVVKVVSFFSTERDYVFRDFKVEVFRVLDFPFFIFPGLFNWINKIRFQHFLIQNNIDEIQFSHSHVAYPSAYLTEDLKCVKMIQHHGLDVFQLLNGRSVFFQKAQRKYLIRNTIQRLNNADLNIGVSYLVLDKLRDCSNYTPAKEFVLYNGVDRSKFFRKETNKNDIFTIGCVANFWKTKGHILLIRSVHSLLEDGCKVRLRLIGSGTTLQYCREYVLKNKLSQYILFEKETTHVKLNNFYNEIDLFVLPSYYEALGCVYLESWATETPFIAIQGQGITEIIKGQDIMIAKQNDVEDLSSKIKYFIDNSIELKFPSHLDIKNTIHDFLDIDIFVNND